MFSVRKSALISPFTVSSTVCSSSIPFSSKRWSSATSNSATSEKRKFTRQFQASILVSGKALKMGSSHIAFAQSDQNLNPDEVHDLEAIGKKVQEALQSIEKFEGLIPKEDKDALVAEGKNISLLESGNQFSTGYVVGKLEEKTFGSMGPAIDLGSSLSSKEGSLGTGGLEMSSTPSTAGVEAAGEALTLIGSILEVFSQFFGGE